MSLEPVSPLTMDGITALLITFVFISVMFCILYDEWNKAKLPEASETPDVRPFAEKIVALLDGQSSEMAFLIINDTDVALAGGRRFTHPNPLVNNLLEVLSCLSTGTAYEATRLASLELDLRPWRTI